MKVEDLIYGIVWLIRYIFTDNVIICLMWFNWARLNKLKKYYFRYLLFVIWLMLSYSFCSEVIPFRCYIVSDYLSKIHFQCLIVNEWNFVIARKSSFKSLHFNNNFLFSYLSRWSFSQSFFGQSLEIFFGVMKLIISTNTNSFFIVSFSGERESIKNLKMLGQFRLG